MVMYAKIRQMFYREHLSISEIQQRTSLSRNTIKKWLKELDGAATKYRRAKVAGLLTPFESSLLLALKADAHCSTRISAILLLVGRKGLLRRMFKILVATSGRKPSSNSSVHSQNSTSG